MISNIQGGAATAVGSVDSSGYVVPKQVTDTDQIAEQAVSNKDLLATSTTIGTDETVVAADTKEKQDNSSKKKLSKEDVGQMTNALNNL